MSEMDRKKERRQNLYAQILAAVLVYLLADTKPIRLLEQRFDEFCGRVYDARHGRINE